MVSYGDRNDLVFSQSTLYSLMLFTTERNVDLDIHYVMLSFDQLSIIQKIRMHLNKNKYVYKWSWHALNLKFMSMRKIQFRMGLYFEREFAWDEKRQQLAFAHDILISLKSEVGVHKTSFIQTFFIEVIVARKSEQLCIFVLSVSILRLAAIYGLIVY